MPSLRPVRAMLFGSHKANSISTSVVFSIAAGGFAAHHARKQFDAIVVGDDHHAVIQRIGPAVERQQALAVLRATDHEIAGDLFGVEHMERPPRSNVMKLVMSTRR